MADAEWLADVAAHGMVRPSLVPGPEARALRELTRYRRAQVSIRAQEVQRLDKVLQDAGIKISSVASVVLGKSTRAMVEALIAGEQDSAVLAAKALGRMRPKIPALTEALAGRFRAHHGAVARAILAHIDFLDATVATLDEEVAARLGPFLAGVVLLRTMTGVGQVTAEVFMAETGGDMSRFPTADHLAAWAGLAPANKESAGKRKPAGSRNGARWLRRALIEAAHAAPRTKGTYLAAQYHQVAARRGPQQGHRGRSPLHGRGRLAHAVHRNALPRPRPRLVQLPARPRARGPPPHRPPRGARPQSDHHSGINNAHNQRPDTTTKT